MNNPEYLTVEESADVDKALLDNEDKFLTRLTISSLRFLKAIAKDYQISLDQLTYQQIIQWIEKDRKMKREQANINLN